MQIDCRIGNIKELNKDHSIFSCLQCLYWRHNFVENVYSYPENKQHYNFLAKYLPQQDPVTDTFKY